MMQQHGTWVIGLTGQAGCGKSTVARHLVKHYGFTEMKFADPLKQMVAREFGYRLEDLDDLAFKQTPDPRWGNRTPREILQIIGTEGFRAVHPEFWVRAAIKRVEHLRLLRGKTRFVFSDTRFLNESAAVKAIGGEVWAIRRFGGPTTLTDEQRAHASEQEILKVVSEADHLLSANWGDIPGLLRNVTYLMTASWRVPARGPVLVHPDDVGKAERLLKGDSKAS